VPECRKSPWSRIFTLEYELANASRYSCMSIPRGPATLICYSARYSELVSQSYDFTDSKC
jgi:hypothetical protein